MTPDGNKGMLSGHLVHSAERQLGPDTVEKLRFCQKLMKKLSIEGRSKDLAVGSAKMREWGRVWVLPVLQGIPEWMEQD